MPKKSKIACPLRKLREITGKTQIEFARLLGCSPSVLKKIEAGDNSKLYEQLILNASLVFGLAPNSLIPPSTHPLRIDGKIYTKKLFDEWWKNAPEKVKPAIQHFKALMVREFEMVLAAAMRVPGMSIGAVFGSFNTWAMETVVDMKLKPHYEAEWKERTEKASKKANPLHTDLEFARLFRENKSQFIQEAFEADLTPTPFMIGPLVEKSGHIKKESDLDGKKKSKSEKLKSSVDFGTEEARKAFQAVMAANAGPKLKR